MHGLALVLLVRLVTADISLATYSSFDCSGSILNNIHSNPAAEFESSSCITTAQYSSVAVLSADPGFQCNVYRDSICQNFIASISSTPCTGTIGESVICFNQALFDNPLAGSKAQVTIGTQYLTSDLSGSGLIEGAVGVACSANGCDRGNQFKREWSHLNKDGTFSVTMEGNYDNTDQRDYMRNLLAKAMNLATQNTRLDLCCSSEDNNRILDVPNFAQVVLNDARGNNVAQMSASLVLTVDAKSSSDCDSIQAKVTQAALGEVPGVGGILAAVFEIGCNAING